MLDLIKTIVFSNTFVALAILVIIADFIKDYLEDKEGPKFIRFIFSATKKLGIVLLVLTAISIWFGDITISEKAHVGYKDKTYSFKTVDMVDKIKKYKKSLLRYTRSIRYQNTRLHVGDLGNIELTTPGNPFASGYLSKKITAILDDDMISYTEFEDLLPLLVDQEVLRKETNKELSKRF